MIAKVKVPASAANLGPGYDCLGIALNIYNEVSVRTLTQNKLEIQVEGQGKDDIDADSSNLVYQGIQTVYQKVNEPIPGLQLSLTNSIPVFRGLGSSGAAIVSGLSLGNILTGNQLTDDELLNLALKLEGHPDNIAPALMGGFTIVGDTSEGIKWIRHVPEFKPTCYVAVPDYVLSTSDAREAIPTNVSHQDAVFNVSRSSMLVGAMMTEDYSLLRHATEDKLHQVYRNSLLPGFNNALERIRELGNIGVALSGAGPSVIVISPHQDDRIKEALRDSYSKEEIYVDIFEVGICDKGVHPTSC